MNIGSKFLVIVVGIPRGGEVVFRSINKNLVKLLNADLAICSEDKYINNNSLSAVAKYLWGIPNDLNWNDYYLKFTNGNYEKYFKAGKDTGLENSGKIHFAIKDIILNKYIEILEKYDFIVYTRFDQFHLKGHPTTFNTNNIYIQEGEDYGGINDRHAIFPATYARKFLNICSYIDSQKAIENIPSHPNCESVFYQFLKDSKLSNIERFKRYQFTVLKVGDITRWRVPTYKIHFSKGLFFKYPYEFVVSFLNYINKCGTIKAFLNHPFLTLNYVILILRKKYSKYIPVKIKNKYRNKIDTKKYFKKI